MTPTGGSQRATVWSGSADSAINLHALLPGGQFNVSEARGIDADGNIVGVAFTTVNTRPHAIVWRVVPEPSGTAMFAAFGVPALLARRRNKQPEVGRTL